MKKQLALSLFLLAAAGALQAQHNHESGADGPASHGMLIFGATVFYASHLPLIDAASPHNYQVILRLKLDAKSAKIFQKDQLDHPEYTTYTISPERFVLPDMVANPRPFKADLYRGHFERGGKLIASAVQITIEKVLVFKKFDPAARRPADTKYLIFGGGKEQYAAHLISNKPDFDHIVQVKTSLAEGSEVVLNETSNEVPGVSGNDLEVKTGKGKAVVTLLRQIYLEFGDLR